VKRPRLDTLDIIAWLLLFGNPFFHKFTDGFFSSPTLLRVWKK